jgi:crotonobetainyl-CoA:carnitine CoA-transferase CaiB-like acyl-CoA transferase
MSAPGPLDGITVLDLTRVLSGPYCTMVLGDLGARVLKVEHPGRGDDTRHWGPPFVSGESTYFLSINRNKESVAVDFKTEEGRGVVHALAARADVIVENFRPGTLARVGLDAATLTARHPRLVYCSISGYGQTGPRRDEPGYDAVIQAEGGLMSITGAPDGPPYRLGVAITDIVTGLFAAQGILAALFVRERRGRGQTLDIGMLDATAALLTYQAAIRFATGQSPPRLGNRHPNIVPYETFDVADGDLVIAVGNDEIWRRFVEAIDLGALAGDPRFATNSGRVTHYEALKPELDRALGRRTRADWTERFTQARVPCGSVRDVAEVLDDPQLAARGMIETLLVRCRWSARR